MAIEKQIGRLVATGLLLVSCGPKAGAVIESGSKPTFKQPIETQLPTATAIPTATVEPSPTPPPTSTPEPSPTPRIVKEIPNVITLVSLEEAGRGIVVWTAEQIETARAEAAQRGEMKIPLEKTVFDLGGKYQTVPNKTGLAIVLDNEMEYKPSALIKGKVQKAARGNSAMNVIRIQGENKRKIQHAFPLNNSMIKVAAGDDVEPNDNIYSTSQDANFEKFVKALGYPEHTRAAIALSNPDDSVIPIDQYNILTDDKGNIVVVESSSALSMNLTKPSVQQQIHPELFARGGYPLKPPTKL